MPTEAVAAVVVFAVMFVLWAVVPSFLKKRHTNRATEEILR